MEPDTEKRNSKKPLLIGLAVVLVLLAAGLVFFLSRPSSEPFTGRWEGVYIMEPNDDIIPILTDTYVKIKGNGALTLYLDEETRFTGTWERSPLGEGLCTLSFDSGGTAVMLYSAENDHLSIMMQSTTIFFQH